jgi:3-methyl-2-oxobutanoate hydroxymethyltransferase
MVVVDMPFGSYQSNSEIALKSAIRIMKESGAHAVKLEGGSEVEESIKRILMAGIPVMGHLGLTPQSIYKFGTYTVRAKEDAEAQKLREDARLLDEHRLLCAGAGKNTGPTRQRVSESIEIPTIGIGAGGTPTDRCWSHTICWASPKISSRASCAATSNVKSSDFPNEKEQY